MAHELPTTATTPPGRRRVAPMRTDGRTMRQSSRALDDGATEAVRVIEFLWPAGGSSVQPVLLVERELLN